VGDGGSQSMLRRGDGPSKIKLELPSDESDLEEISQEEAPCARLDLSSIRGAIEEAKKMSESSSWMKKDAGETERETKRNAETIEKLKADVAELESEPRGAPRRRAGVKQNVGTDTRLNGARGRGTVTTPPRRLSREAPATPPSRRLSREVPASPPSRSLSTEAPALPLPRRLSRSTPASRSKSPPASKIPRAQLRAKERDGLVTSMDQSIQVQHLICQVRDRHI
jgi:hypothetical protein